MSLNENFVKNTLHNAKTKEAIVSHVRSKLFSCEDMLPHMKRGTITKITDKQIHILSEDGKKVIMPLDARTKPLYASKSNKIALQLYNSALDRNKKDIVKENVFFQALIWFTIEDYAKALDMTKGKKKYQVVRNDGPTSVGKLSRSSHGGIKAASTVIWEGFLSSPEKCPIYDQVNGYNTIIRKVD